MSDGDQDDDTEAPYYLMFPELTLTAQDFQALSLRDEDISQVLSPTQHPLDLSPDFQDFADLANHILTERRNSTGEWEQELFGRPYLLPLSEGPITPEEGSLLGATAALDTPSQYPLDDLGTTTRNLSLLGSPFPMAVPTSPRGSYLREQSDGAQTEPNHQPSTKQLKNFSVVVRSRADDWNFPRQTRTQDLSTEASSSTAKFSWPPEDPDTCKATSDPLNSSFNKAMVPRVMATPASSSSGSSSPTSRRKFRGHSKAEGSRHRAIVDRSIGALPKDKDRIRLQRKRASGASSTAEQQPGPSTTTVIPVVRVASNNFLPREGPSDGFEARETAALPTSNPETTPDEHRGGVDAVSGWRYASLQILPEDAKFFFDQPRGEPMGSEGGMMATVTAVPGPPRKFSAGAAGGTTTSEDGYSDGEIFQNRVRDYAGQSSSGEEGSGSSSVESETLAKDVNTSSVWRTDWLRGIVEGSDDTENLFSGPAGRAVAPPSSVPLSAWWQPALGISGTTYPDVSPDPVVDQEGNVRPPLVGQSEDNLTVATSVPLTGGLFISIPEVSITGLDYGSRTPDSSTSHSTELCPSSKASLLASTSTLASKDSLAFHVNNLLQQAEVPSWLASDDDDDDVNHNHEAVGNDGRKAGSLRGATQLPLASPNHRKFTKAVSFDKKDDLGHEAEKCNLEGEEACESHFSSVSEITDASMREDSNKAEVYDQEGHRKIQLPSPLYSGAADRKEQLSISKHSDDPQFGLSSLELTDAEQFGGPPAPRCDASVDPQQRATSPSVMSVSSVASSKRLEWDSGADIGYGGGIRYGLSTLERMAISSYPTVLQRMEPEGKSSLAKDGIAGVVASGSGVVGPALPLPSLTFNCPHDGDVTLLDHIVSPQKNDSDATIGKGCVFSFPIKVCPPQSRAKDDQRELIFSPETHPQSPESGKKHSVPVTAKPVLPDSGVPSSREPVSFGQRSNSMMDLSQTNKLGRGEPTRWLCADDKRHSLSTSDMKKIDDSSGRLHSLINSWFSSTSAISTSSGGTIVPVGPSAGPTPLFSDLGVRLPHQHPLCSTALEGSKSSQHCLSFSTPSSNIEFGSTNTSARLPSRNLNVAVPAVRTVEPQNPDQRNVFIRSDSFLVGPNRPSRSVKAEKSGLLSRVPASPPLPPEIEQEVGGRLLAFAEKFVSNLYPTADPARRLRMAGRILGDIGHALSGSADARMKPKLNVPVEAEIGGVPDDPRSKFSADGLSVSSDAPPSKYCMKSQRIPSEISNQPEEFSTSEKVEELQSTLPLRAPTPANASQLHTQANFQTGSQSEDSRSSARPVLRNGWRASGRVSSRIASSQTGTQTSNVSESTTGSYEKEILSLDKLRHPASTSDTETANSAAPWSSSLNSHNAPDTVSNFSSYRTSSEEARSSDRWQNSKASRRSTVRRVTSAFSRTSEFSSVPANDNDFTSYVKAVSSSDHAPLNSFPASPESLRIIRELVRRQRRSYIKTLQKEVAWLERVEAMLGRKDGAHGSSRVVPHASRKERSPRKGRLDGISSLGVIANQAESDSRYKSTNTQRPTKPAQIVKRPPVKTTKDFGQSYPTPCPSDVQLDHRNPFSKRERGARSNSTSASSECVVTSDLAVVDLESGRRAADDERLIVAVVPPGRRSRRVAGVGKNQAATERRPAVNANRNVERYSAIAATATMNNRFVMIGERPSVPIGDGANGTSVVARRPMAWFLPLDGGVSDHHLSERLGHGDGQEDLADNRTGQNLQEAFRQLRATTVERMERRQRDLHATTARRERLNTMPPLPSNKSEGVINLLEIRTLNPKYTVPLPVSGQHHRPFHRGFTYQQMKWQTEKLCRILPEVTTKMERKRREATQLTNRQLARRFNKKLQEFALCGKVHHRHTPKCL